MNIIDYLHAAAKEISLNKFYPYHFTVVEEDDGQFYRVSLVTEWNGTAFTEFHLHHSDEDSAYKEETQQRLLNGIVALGITQVYRAKADLLGEKFVK